MSRGRAKTAANKRVRPSDRRPDEVALVSALDAINKFVESLELRVERASERADKIASGTPAAVRATRRVEDTRAELEASRRLREEVRAAVAIATAELAIIEASATKAIRSAFGQFANARAIRRGSTGSKTTSSRRLRTARGEPRSMEELGEMAAEAKQATARVIADRERLAQWLAEARLQAAALTVSREAPHSSDTARREHATPLATACEHWVAYLHQQLVAQTEAAERLKVGLRRLFERLPEPAAKAAEVYRRRDDKNDDAE